MSKIPKRRRAGQRVRRPKNLAQFDALPKRSQVAWDKTGSVVTRVRKGESLRAASLELGIDSRTVMRLAGSALRKNAGGRYVVSPTDFTASSARTGSRRQRRSRAAWFAGIDGGIYSFRRPTAFQCDRR